MLNKYDKLLPFAQQFLLRTIGRANSYHSTLPGREFKREWKTPDKVRLAKHLTQNTIVQSKYANRQPSQLDTSRAPHESVKYLTNCFYDSSVKDAVDKIPVSCPEHLILMRMAVSISRTPETNSVKILYAVTDKLVQILSNLDKKTLYAIFIVGGDIKESRSIGLISNTDTWLKTLQNYKNLPINKLSRILETVISPLGNILNTLDTPHSLIKKAQNKQIDIGKLEDFIKSINEVCKKYYIPYIKGSEGPFFHLTSKQYVEGEFLYSREIATLSQYLENCEDCEGHDWSMNQNLAGVPHLRRLKIFDPTNRSALLHGGFNVPHYFDVSGTTGAVMQAIMGILDLADQRHLLANPDDYRTFGMVFAGCNFTKQGFHNFYEIYPALEWGAENIYKVKGLYNIQPRKLVEVTSNLLKTCVDPLSNMHKTIIDAADIFKEHSIRHYEIYKRALAIETKKIVDDFERQAKNSESNENLPSFKRT